MLGRADHPTLTPAGTRPGGQEEVADRENRRHRPMVADHVDVYERLLDEGWQRSSSWS
jgi:hypothetical protein